MLHSNSKGRRVRLTAYLPSHLVSAADKLVEEGRFKDRIELLITALHRMFHEIEEKRIDAEIARVANDPEYLSESLKIEAEFAALRWEAFQTGEQAYLG